MELFDIQTALEQVVEPFKPASDYRTIFGTGFEAGMRSSLARHRFIANYGFMLVTQETLEALVRLCHGKRVLDAGAGTGYLAKALEDHGIDVLAADRKNYSEGKHGYPFRQQFKLDYIGDVTEILPGQFDVVMLCWPCYNKPFGYDVAKRLQPGQTLIYQGEGFGGCTADDAFHEFVGNTQYWQKDDAQTAMLNAAHLQFSGIHDTWQVYQRI